MPRTKTEPESPEQTDQSLMATMPVRQYLANIDQMDQLNTDLFELKKENSILNMKIETLERGLIARYNRLRSN